MHLTIFTLVNAFFFWFEFFFGQKSEVLETSIIMRIRGPEKEVRGQANDQFLCAEVSKSLEERIQNVISESCHSITINGKEVVHATGK